MKRKLNKIICLRCNQEHFTPDKRTKFCSRMCANRNRNNYTEILNGKKFFWLEVIRFSHKTADRRYHWFVKCKCGVVKSVNGKDMVSGKIKSCGCYKNILNRAQLTTHGLSEHPLFKRWQAMKARCHPESSNKKHYYNKGIAYCKRWEKFENFYKDMLPGFDPSLSLDRKNNSRGYSPSNCRWATQKQQCNNQDRNKRVVYRGVEYSLSELSEKLQISYTTLYSRNKLGVQLDKPVKDLG